MYQPFREAGCCSGGSRRACFSSCGAWLEPVLETCGILVPGPGDQNPCPLHWQRILNHWANAAESLLLRFYEWVCCPCSVMSESFRCLPFPSPGHCHSEMKKDGSLRLLCQALQLTLWIGSAEFTSSELMQQTR